MRRALRLPYLATDRELFSRLDGPSPEHRRLLEAREAAACVEAWVTDDRAYRSLVRWLREYGGSLQHGLDEARRRALLGDWLRSQIERGTFLVAEIAAPPPLPPTRVARPREELRPRVSEDAPEDVFLLVAEVKLLGDTPLVRHAVRILDPDGGQPVAEAETDERGVVRVEVPGNKTYRIEIVDEAPPLPAWDTIHIPQAVLRCRLVDPTGVPIPHLDVTIRDCDGRSTEATTDEEGGLEVSVELGVYQVVVGEDTHWVHALLLDDVTEAYEVVVALDADEEAPPTLDSLQGRFPWHAGVDDLEGFDDRDEPVDLEGPDDLDEGELA